MPRFIQQGQHFPIPKLQEDTTKKKEHYRPICLSNIDVKNIQQTILKLKWWVINHDQVGLIVELQGWFNIQKSINGIHYVNKRKNKNQMIST